MKSALRKSYFRPRLGLEALEGRDVPATVQISTVELIDSSDTLIDQNTLPLFVGEQMFFRITYVATDLPTNAEYGLSVTVQNSTQSASGITAGAGISGSTTYVINTAAQFAGSSWYAQLGFNDVETSMYSQVGFTDSSYDYSSFESFFPTNQELPFKLSRPINGQQNKTWVVSNNLDYNPDFNFFGNDGILDYQGGYFTSDGQTLTEFQLADFSSGDTGVQVLSAAAGTVVEVFNDAYDRNYDLTAPYQLANADYGNYVVIDHNDGWYTLYSGLRADSLRVDVGDQINSGVVLGLVGGSGLPSLGARLGFSFYYDRGTGAIAKVDPFAGQFGGNFYWATGAAPAYQGTTPASLFSGVTNYQFWTDTTAEAERPARVAQFAPGSEVNFWSSGTQAVGSTISIVLYDPSGNTVSQTSFPATATFDRTRATFTLPTSAVTGNWRIVMSVDGTQVATQTFGVSPAPATPAVYARAQQPIGPPIGTYYLVPNRTTPFNLGTWSQGSISPQASIFFTNIGSAPLVLGTPQTTSGFKFYDYPTAAIAPGQTVEFGIGFAGTVSGLISGQFRIPTNDPNVPFFDGTVKGISREGSTGSVDSGGTGNTVTGNVLNNPLVGTLDGLAIRVPPATPGLAPGAVAVISDNSFSVGSDTGLGQVVVFARDGNERFRLEPFPGFTGGVRTTMADFNNDGVDDLVVGTGPGTRTLVRILNGRTNRPLYEIQPFEESFTGGVFVTSGDVNNDGIADLIITPDEGGGPRVRILDGNTAGQGQTAIVLDFFGISDNAFRGGARASVGDINGDGRPDLVVAAGFGGGPRIAVFDGTTLTSRAPARLFSDFLAFELGLRNGVFVSVGDVNSDGKGDLIVGGGPGGAPRVSIFSGSDLMNNTKTMIGNFFAGDSESRGGVRLTVNDLNGDGSPDLVVGSGSGQFSQLTSYPLSQLTNSRPRPELNLTIFQDFTGGVFVG